MTKDHGQGTISFCSREDHVWPAFTTCLARLTRLHPEADVRPAIGASVADQRNACVAAMLANPEAQWIWFIDTDMTFAEVTLRMLLEDDVAVVQGIVLFRGAPHAPVMYSQDAVRNDQGISGPPRLRKVLSCGAGGTLYRRRVFERIPQPWFEGPLGVEDTNLAAKAVAAGFDLHVDMRVPMGHLTPVAVWPAYDERTGKWNAKYVTTSGAMLDLPPYQPQPGELVLATR